jgi:hypothetical protein
MPNITPRLLKAAEVQLNYQVVDGDIEGNHFILFIRDFKVCGHIKSNSQGTSWNIPDDVAALA